MIKYAIFDIIEQRFLQVQDLRAFASCSYDNHAKFVVFAEKEQAEHICRMLRPYNRYKTIPVDFAEIYEERNTES
jgi:hypothetical protein